MELAEIIPAFLLPPPAVALRTGLSRKVLIALLLALLGQHPGRHRRPLRHQPRPAQRRA